MHFIRSLENPEKGVYQPIRGDMLLHNSDSAYTGIHMFGMALDARKKLASAIETLQIRSMLIFFGDIKYKEALQLAGISML